MVVWVYLVRCLWVELFGWGGGFGLIFGVGCGFLVFRFWVGVLGCGFWVDIGCGLDVWAGFWVDGCGCFGGLFSFWGGVV